MSRSSFALDAIKTRLAFPKVNALVKAADADKGRQRHLGPRHHRATALADALNHAKSDKNTDLQAALRATDILGNQTICPGRASGSMRRGRTKTASR